MQFGPSRSPWAHGSSSMRLSRTKEDSMPEISRNKFSMPNQNDSGPASIGGYPMQPPSHDAGFRAYSSGPSRSVGLPDRGSRGPSVDSGRRRAVEPIKQSTRPNGREHAEVGGQPMSIGPLTIGRPAADTISEVNAPREQAKQLRGKHDMDADKIGKQAKLLLDEFLHEGNEQVITASDPLNCPTSDPRIHTQMMYNPIAITPDPIILSCFKSFFKFLF